MKYINRKFVLIPRSQAIWFLTDIYPDLAFIGSARVLYLSIYIYKAWFLWREVKGTWQSSITGWSLVRGSRCVELGGGGGGGGGGPLQVKIVVTRALMNERTDSIFFWSPLANCSYGSWPRLADWLRITPRLWIFAMSIYIYRCPITRVLWSGCLSPSMSRLAG